MISCRFSRSLRATRVQAFLLFFLNFLFFMFVVYLLEASHDDVSWSRSRHLLVFASIQHYPHHRRRARKLSFIGRFPFKFWTSFCFLLRLIIFSCARFYCYYIFEERKLYSINMRAVNSRDGEHKKRAKKKAKLISFWRCWAFANFLISFWRSWNSFVASLTSHFQRRKYVCCTRVREGKTRQDFFFTTLKLIVMKSWRK